MPLLYLAGFIPLAVFNLIVQAGWFLFSMLIAWANWAIVFSVSSFWNLFGPGIITSFVLGGGLYQASTLGVFNDNFSPDPGAIQYSVNFANVVPLAAQDDPNRNATVFRVVADKGTPKQMIKYVWVSYDVQAFGVRKRNSDTSVIQMPPLPAGDCTRADIALTEDGKQITVTATGCETFASVGEDHLFHPDIFDIFDLDIIAVPHNSERVKLVSHPKLDTYEHLAVLKYAPFPDGIAKIATETMMYQLIEHSEIGPRFLGHVRENGRVVGFLLEYFPGGPADSKDRHSDLAIDKCTKALDGLHFLGIVHGDAHPRNCLIGKGKDGRAVLISFGLAEETTLVSSFELDKKLMRQSIAIEQ
ncbi:hypothetical protein F5Y10DRAFT_66597 [Nemania abortiva]|nr:hypothetical protein F5Y10DRAFT_66597 [Nemania abortiva]